MMAPVSKIDVSRYVAELERVLRSRGDRLRRQEAITILQRWQADEMLDESCREKARTLLSEFDPVYRIEKYLARSSTGLTVA